MKLRMKLTLDGPIWIIAETLEYLIPKLISNVDDEDTLHDLNLICKVYFHIMLEKPSLEKFLENEEFCKIAYDSLLLLDDTSVSQGTRMMGVREMVLAEHFGWDGDDYSNKILKTKNSITIEEESV